jgi:hypothetical protein
MKLHVIYRSYAGENLKNRPGFYSKDVALASLLRAVENAGVNTELLFVNDGFIPPHRLEVMRQAGETVSVQCGSNRRSYGVAIGLPRQRRWDDRDLVWLSEDDYLYTPDALSELLTGAKRIQVADYFSLYCDLEIVDVDGRRPQMIRHPAYKSVDAEPKDVRPRRWYRAATSTSTYGVRAGTMRADERLLRLCSFSGGAWDHASCMTYQGFQPYPWVHLLPGGVGEPRQGMGGLIRITARGAVRTVLNGTALARQPRRRRVVAGVGPNPITHMEVPYLASGTPWSDIAAETRAWGMSNGFHQNSLEGVSDLPFG